MCFILLTLLVVGYGTLFWNSCFASRLLMFGFTLVCVGGLVLRFCFGVSCGGLFVLGFVWVGFVGLFVYLFVDFV